jgi:hypothetical protein
MGPLDVSETPHKLNKIVDKINQHVGSASIHTESRIHAEDKMGAGSE